MMVIADTSPVNYLVLIGSVDILPQLYGRVLVPPSVCSELQHPRAPETVRAWTAAGTRETGAFRSLLERHHPTTFFVIQKRARINSGI